MRRKILVLLPLVLALAGSVFADEPPLANPKWNALPRAPGVTLRESTVEKPRHLRLKALKIDLKTPGLKFTGTGRCPGWGEPLAEAKTLYVKDVKRPDAFKRTALESTQSFFARCARPVAAGGRGLDMIAAFGMSQGDPPYSGGFARPNGIIISDGETVSAAPGGNVALVIRKDGRADIVQNLPAAEFADVDFARSGYSALRLNGQLATTSTSRRGRTALGLTADRRWLYLVSADVEDESRCVSDGISNVEFDYLMSLFSVADAVICGFGRNAEIVVRDAQNPAGRSLNGYASPAPMVQYNGGLYLERKAGAPEKPAKAEKPVKPVKPVTAAKETKPSNPVEAKIVNGRLSMFKAKPGNQSVLRGEVKISVRTDLPRIKRPMLNVIALFDIDGMWRWCDVLCSEPNQSYGSCLPREATPARYSSYQAEVSADAWDSVTFGNPKTSFFTGYAVPEKAKLLLYRLEVWQDGKLLASQDSDRRLAKKLALPEDWYVKGKYPGKFSYRYPPPPAK